MTGDAISIKKIRCRTYFIKNEKKEENSPTLCIEKVMSALYWLYKEEVVHSKLNSLLELFEFLGLEKVTTFKNRSSRVPRELLILGSQVKENLLKWIKKSPFAGIRTDEVVDIANIQNLFTFIKIYDGGHWKAEAAFIGSADLLHFPETKSRCKNNTWLSDRSYL